MSSRAKKVEKTMVKGKFIDEMYNTLLGSFLISLYILGKVANLDAKDLINYYKKEKRDWINNNVSNETWMQDCIDDLNTLAYKKAQSNNEEEVTLIEIPYNLIAFVNAPWNSLIAPYIDLGEGEQLLPLREDGFKGPTLLKGKIYPIQKEVTNNIEL